MNSPITNLLIGLPLLSLLSTERASAYYDPGVHQSIDGQSWCHKFRGKAPTNLDVNGKVITDPQPGDILDFGDFSYKFCGFLCAPASAK